MDGLEDTFKRVNEILEKPGRTPEDEKKLNKYIEWMAECAVSNIPDEPMEDKIGNVMNIKREAK